MIGTRFEKPLKDFDGYSKAAEWANNNGAVIVDVGEYYEVQEPSAPTTEELAAEVRSERDAKLKQIVDPALRDQLYEDEFPDAELKQYRQNLLDVPQQAGFPNDVQWPEVPESLKKYEIE